eukprot:1748014-Heterocapsa_arctica.AAC.1
MNEKPHVPHVHPCWLQGSRLVMQTALRAALGELAHGLSTGLIIFAGSKCPECGCLPSLHCLEAVRCPECHSHGG